MEENYKVDEDTNEEKDDLVEEREDYFMLNSSYEEYLDKNT